MRVHCHDGLTPETERQKNAIYDLLSTRVELSSRASCQLDKLEKSNRTHSNHAATACLLYKRLPHELSRDRVLKSADSRYQGHDLRHTVHGPNLCLLLGPPLKKTKPGSFHFTVTAY
jgi:hypothetical protein